MMTVSSLDQDIRARDIERVLRDYHHRRGDLFFTEVCCGRNGSFAQGMRGRGARAPRMDALAIPRRWDRIIVMAYEIKISRADFRHDDKWVEYLNWCNRFYFATPKGLLTQDEIAELRDSGVGVVEVRRQVNKPKLLTCRFTSAAAVAPFVGGHIPWELYHTLLLNKVRGG